MINARAILLQSAVKRLTPEQIKMCDAMSDTIEELLDNLSATLIRSREDVANEALPPGL
jgi:hypothetical protein